MLSSLHTSAIELDAVATSPAFVPGSSSRDDFEPLLFRSHSTTLRHALEHSTREHSLSGLAGRWLFSLLPTQIQHQSVFIMARLRSSKASHLLSKLATDSEPGLTSAQLMLTNEDLKPVEPERRQWGPWNFVGEDDYIIDTWLYWSTNTRQDSGLPILSTSTPG